MLRAARGAIHPPCCLCPLLHSPLPLRVPFALGSRLCPPIHFAAPPGALACIVCSPAHCLLAHALLCVVRASQTSLRCPGCVCHLFRRPASLIGLRTPLSPCGLSPLLSIFSLPCVVAWPVSPLLSPAGPFPFLSRASAYTAMHPLGLSTCSKGLLFRSSP